MPPEQYIDPSHYLLERTDSFLRDYIDTRFTALEKAILLAERNNEIRLEGLNEWRGQSKDQMSTYATKIEVDTLKESVNTLRLERAEKEKTYVTKAELDAAQAGKKDSIALLIAGIALLVTIIGLLFR